MRRPFAYCAWSLAAAGLASASVRGAAAMAAVLAAGSAATFACGDFTENPGDAPGAGDSEAGADGPAATGDGAPVPPCETAKVDSDANHCGRCGHSCLGGACVAGACQPVLVGRTTEPILDVAVTNDQVLWLTTKGAWSDRGHLYACAKTGCNGTPASLVSTTDDMGPQTGSLVGDGTNAFASFVFGSRQVVQIKGGQAQQIAPISGFTLGPSTADTRRARIGGTA